MKKTLLGLALAGASLTAAVHAVRPAGQAGPTPSPMYPSERVSLDSNGAQIDHVPAEYCRKNNSHPTVADGGDLVAWATYASGVDTSVPNAMSPCPKTHVYVRSASGAPATMMASQSRFGGQNPNGMADNARLSGDGNWLAFLSTSKFLTAEDDAEELGYQDVFVFHVPDHASVPNDCSFQRASQIPASVSLTRDGGNGNCGTTVGISYDGRYIAFSSQADNLQTVATAGGCTVQPGFYLKPVTGGKKQRARTEQIYLLDRGPSLLDLSGCYDDSDDAIHWISTGCDGAGCCQPDGPSFKPTVSDDGMLVAFESDAKNLLPAGAIIEPSRQVYLRDLGTGTTHLVSRDSGGMPATENAQRATLSGDGTHVVFETKAALDASDTNGLEDIYRYDVASQTVSLVSTAAASTKSIAASVSTDGRYVAYTEQTTGGYDLWLIDLGPPAGSPVKLGLNDPLLGGGDPNGYTGGPVGLSPDGQWVVFMTTAFDLNTTQAPSDGNCLTAGGGCPGKICHKITGLCEEGRDIYRLQIF